jgi:hypothetical protein
MSKDAEAALLHEMWYVDGKADALRFAWDCKGNADQIQNKIREVKEYIYNPPPSLKDRMAPEASTRVYQEGYLQGLTDIIGILENVGNGNEAAPAKIVARPA